MEEKKEGVGIVSPLQPESGITQADLQLDYDRDARIMPIVRKIFEILHTKEDLMVGMTPKGMTSPEFKEAQVKNYVPVAEEVIKLMIENKVRVSEMKYCFAVAGEALEFATKFAQNTIDNELERVTAQLFGKKDVSEIEVADIEKVLLNKKD